ncbi:MAG TPA: GDYXXLXY domain-containing protein [Ramlibacter sp.]|nr:GDYXXLXY domain-containing protein [Ramlibacter sp.]
MSNETLQRAVDAAIRRGLLPEGAQLPAQDGRPWPVSLLVALGAWLAAIPLIGVVGILFSPLVRNSGGALAVGALVIAASVVVLRSRALPVFVEQLAVPGLLVGGGALGFAFFDMLPRQPACAVLGMVALVVAAVIDRAWLRVLLGVAAAALCVLALGPTRLFNGLSGSMTSVWFALHGALLVWLVAMIGQRFLDTPRAAAWVESVAAGWLLALLVGLAGWSGMTFMVGGSFGGFIGELANELGSRGGRSSDAFRVMQACSVVAGLAAVLLAGRRWPALRDPATAAVGLVLAGLSWFLPALGGVLLALAWTATTQRWRLAGAAAVAAAWIAGSFYYQLAWPLAQKALVLAAAGVALGALAWLARMRAAPAGVNSTRQAPPQMTFERRSAALMLAAAVMTLVLANFSIWQKESLIASGQKVFVALAPVDPRSLMQGDFMRLNYSIPSLADESAGHEMTGARPHVIARRDASGLATLLRTAPAGAPLAEGEIRIELTPIAGRWMLVSDAWYFREGDAKRWEAAKYGEFRVAPNGKALLVGLADQQLKAIPIAP